jgi:hypothetical protein
VGSAHRPCLGNRYLMVGTAHPTVCFFGAHYMLRARSAPYKINSSIR